MVVVGDGPAGTALAAACHRRRLEVVLVGDDDPWSATYATWLDDVPHLEEWHDGSLLATVVPEIRVYGFERHDLARSYGVFDNDRLRRALRRGVPHRIGRVVAVRAVGGGHLVEIAGQRPLRARLVVDASGWPPAVARSTRTRRVPAWQTAFGAVLPEPPPGDLGEPTLMDFRPVDVDDGVEAPTFCYALPIADGWLVEETVLAARRAVAPERLGARLAARLGIAASALASTAVRTEAVRIPMGMDLPDPASPIPAFGAAAAYVHPATGFSVAAALRAADRVAQAASLLDAGAVSAAVWPRSARRLRALHDFGLDVVLRLDPDSVRTFFDTFFDASPDDWSAYLRIDTPPADVAAIMLRLFRRAPWSLRRHLLAGDPRALGRLLRG